MELILVRHGHVEGIEPPRFRGRQDLALTPRGEREASATAARIAGRWKPSRMYTSPLRRTRQTAEAIRAATGLSPVERDAFIDINYGEWHGHTYDEVRERWSAEFDLWMQAPHLTLIPQGETLQEIAARATRHESGSTDHERRSSPGGFGRR